ncbi:AzlC family ABC transporter permease [Lutimaribacter saemankumensis]|uniref:4-azaleucine resistance probable transporter AzlC n=1 Tax=Lutimaribacter saemankumensis TaxID=490829 RepID=A0A1G8KXM5_9RHOB|nr:AzlC family ABC transporter permease [Lutimaribacter saemankumensis]SDI47650.1 4-azaleucine resistance probable transporter AzlC [Lutimaribacter saemankumensis]
MTEEAKSAYWQGFRDGAPFFLVVTPFALLFGVVATESGLSVIEALSFSVVVIAGAAQFTALQLLLDNAPVFVALASALAVNLRMAMYSASLTPHLGRAPMWQRALIAYFLVDQSYACSIIAYERHRDWTVPEKVAYFFGVITPICPMWYAMTLLGALIGNAIPPEFGLDFAVPITFIALIAPMLRTGAHRAAALASVVLALGFAWMPFNLGLMVAALGAMMVGAQVEVVLRRRGLWVDP